jgi:plastocyanin
MLKAPIRSSVLVAGLVAVLVLDLLVGGVLGALLGTTLLANRAAAPRASAQRPRTALSLATVTIAQGQDLFEPFILAVPPNTTITWQNNDSVAHTITTTPDQTPFLNLHAFSLTVAAGQRAGVKLSEPGLYHYYDPTKATWNTPDARVAANKGVPNYPLAMDGVIWVTGPISNLPSATTNRIPPKHDDFVSEFLAISPGSVSWHNFDSDPHFVALVPGWAATSDPPQAAINPVDIGVNRIAGTDDVPGGDTITVIFSKPGLYYYYCVNHAHIDAATHRAEAFKMASEYPIPMEGFVLVTDG